MEQRVGQQVHTDPTVATVLNTSLEVMANIISAVGTDVHSPPAEEVAVAQKRDRSKVTRPKADDSWVQEPARRTAYGYPGQPAAQHKGQLGDAAATPRVPMPCATSAVVHSAASSSSSGAAPAPSTTWSLCDRAWGRGQMQA